MFRQAENHVTSTCRMAKIVNITFDAFISDHHEQSDVI